jgi:fatty-acyl-CoA synthase
VFIATAAVRPDRVAITQVMTGAPDEVRASHHLRRAARLVRRAANLFASLAGPRPASPTCCRALIETHATLWGAETAGFAVPINFLLQPEAIARLLEASGARILVRWARTRCSTSGRRRLRSAIAFRH